VIIDAHVHTFLASSERYPRAVGALAPANREATVESLLRAMDAAGVDGAVLVPLGPEDGYVFDCVQRYPGRFVSIGVADLAALATEPAGHAVATLARRVHRMRIRGLRVNWLGDPGAAFRESPARPVLRWMAEQRLVLWFYAPPAQLPLLAAAVAEFGDLTVVLNHLGFCPDSMQVDDHRRPRIATAVPPPTLDTVLALAAAPGVRVLISGQYAFSTAGYPYPDLDPVVRAVHGSFGATRLMWASDFPWPAEFPGYQALADLPDRHLPGLTADERTQIYGRTAMSVFPGGWDT
jgi:L-fuconolactonase